jgi:hypothetical protein
VLTLIGSMRVPIALSALFRIGFIIAVASAAVASVR